MIDRVQDQFGLYPERVAADTAYGSAEMLGWLEHSRIGWNRRKGIPEPGKV